MRALMFGRSASSSTTALSELLRSDELQTFHKKGNKKLVEIMEFLGCLPTLPARYSSNIDQRRESNRNSSFNFFSVLVDWQY